MKQRVKGVVLVQVPEYVQQCDGCEADLDCQMKKEDTATLTFNLGYLSNDDGAYGEYHFCQDCALDVYQHLQGRFPALVPLENRHES